VYWYELTGADQVKPVPTVCFETSHNKPRLCGEPFWTSKIMQWAKQQPNLSAATVDTKLNKDWTDIYK
jgi:hypothetical protein